jgi:hypothetical protein
MQYIGELCRYLASAPPSPLDGSQPIKCAIGNGLRPEVWEKFVRRYSVAKVRMMRVIMMRLMMVMKDGDENE